MDNLKDKFKQLTAQVSNTVNASTKPKFSGSGRTLGSAQQAISGILLMIGAGVESGQSAHTVLLVLTHLACQGTARAD